MLQFTNSFYCSYNKDQNKLIIRFRQTEPIPSDSNNEEDTQPEIEMHDLVSLVMDADFAQRLADAVKELCDGNTSKAEMPGNEADK